MFSCRQGCYRVTSWASLIQYIYDCNVFLNEEIFIQVDEIATRVASWASLIQDIYECNIIFLILLMMIYWPGYSWKKPGTSFFQLLEDPLSNEFDWFCHVRDHVSFFQKWCLVSKLHIRKSYDFIEIYPSAKAYSENNFFFKSRKKPKNNNRTFPVVIYFTWKLEFISNILLMIVPANRFLLRTRPTSLQTWFAQQF